jgi:hypothetical protein
MGANGGGDDKTAAYSECINLQFPSEAGDRTYLLAKDHTERTAVSLEAK